MKDLKQQLESYFDRLWPICRSIMGQGFRESLDILSEIIPVSRLRFKSGSKVFDWTVPKEWVIRDAYFIDSKGKKHCDFKQNNVHVVNYSAPFSGIVTLEELKKHLHSLPDQPDAVPYITSYYQERWGFCISHDELMSLPEGPCEVMIDSELKDGILEVGEAVLPGGEEEILFSTYLCHPSLANNELSGPLVTAFLYEKIAALKTRRYTYRFVICPETIGSICYLTERGDYLKNKLAAGYVLTCVGDKGSFTYKESRDGQTLADRAAKSVLKEHGDHTIVPFFPDGGSDERQYCSPGFNLPVGSLMRTMYGKYKEYHTSLDNKTFISFDALLETLNVYWEIVLALEANETWVNTIMRGEPQLGKRGLYPTLGTKQEVENLVSAIMWLMNLADGTRDLLAIAEKSGCRLEDLRKVVVKLAEAGLISCPDKINKQPYAGAAQAVK